MTTYRVLVTGSAGTIGKLVAQELLAHGHYVRGLDLQPNPAIPDSRVGSIVDAETVERAFDGMDSVIHLAAYPNDADFLSVLLAPNIIGLYHVMEATRRHAIRRLVLASSIQAVSGLHDCPKPISAAHPPTPRNHYGLTKAYAELQATMYAHRWNLSILAIRIGWLPRTVQEVAGMVQRSGAPHVYFSHRDAARFFRLAIEKETVPFTVLFAMSKNALGHFDLETSRAVIGYEPADTFPEGLAFELPEELRR
jgi:uronate dehydrogenase